MKQLAVLSGDFIDSTAYETSLLKGVVKLLKQEFKSISKAYPDESMTFIMYRGDSFQGVIENPSLALLVALQIKAAITKYNPRKGVSNNSAPSADIRISIGVGEATYQKRALAESNGAAFQFSGRTLDAMKGEGKKMALTTNEKEINNEFNVSLKFLDAVTDRWSVASAEVVYYLLKNYTEQQIANEVGISQAAVNSRKKAAGWEEIQFLLKRYAQVAEKHFV